MTEVRVVPAKDSPRGDDGWPYDLVGDMGMHLTLFSSRSSAEAIYLDQFQDEYSLFDGRDDEWYVDVRDD